MENMRERIKKELSEKESSLEDSNENYAKERCGLM
jgi:hypothetical protein